MTLSDILRDDVLDAVSNYLRLDTSDDVRKRLLRALKAAEAVEDLLNLKDLEKDADELRKAREAHSRTRLLERLTANLARVLIKLAVGQQADPLPEHAADWISYNVTASTSNADRVKAILRHVTGLGTQGDGILYDHAVESALAGQTIEPAPGADPESGTETTMYDPTENRKKLMEHTVFNLAGLPPALRDEKNQEI